MAVLLFHSLKPFTCTSFRLKERWRRRETEKVEAEEQRGERKREKAAENQNGMPAPLAATHSQPMAALCLLVEAAVIRDYPGKPCPKRNIYGWLVITTPTIGFERYGSEGRRRRAQVDRVPVPVTNAVLSGGPGRKQLRRC